MKLSLIFFISVVIICLAYEKVTAFYYGDTGTPSNEEIHIGKTAIVVPTNSILIVRKHDNYCAIKFIKIWKENSTDNFYAEYESYHQVNKSGLFSKNNALHNDGKLSFPAPRGIGRFSFSFGNKEIICGPIKLFWSGDGSVHFYGENQQQGDYGIEIAPTPWSDISQVNISDPRIKWYRYDDKRQRVNIPIDKLWPEAEAPAQPGPTKP
ncbi:MAG: hypothetical protein ACOY8P_01120 [Thermodesulfobacteriota bacterium]